MDSKVNKIECKCKKCGKITYMWPSQKKEYCSRQCYHDDRYLGNDYKKIGHKRADRLRASAIIGKKIPKKAQLHHFKGKSGPFVICEDQKYHYLLHLRARAIEAVGDPHKRMYQFCKEWDDVDNLYIYKNKNVRHKECHNNYKRNASI